MSPRAAWAGAQTGLIWQANRSCASASLKRAFEGLQQAVDLSGGDPSSLNDLGNAYVTRADFKHIGIDPHRWIHANGWLVGRGDGTFVPSQYYPGFKHQHPKVRAEIAATADKWMLKEPTIKQFNMEL